MASCLALVDVVRERVRTNPVVQAFRCDLGHSCRTAVGVGGARDSAGTAVARDTKDGRPDIRLEILEERGD